MAAIAAGVRVLDDLLAGVARLRRLEVFAAKLAAGISPLGQSL